jgi:hypothetical protein
MTDAKNKANLVKPDVFLLGVTTAISSLSQLLHATIVPDQMDDYERQTVAIEGIKALMTLVDEMY